MHTTQSPPGVVPPIEVDPGKSDDSEDDKDVPPDLGDPTVGGSGGVSNAVIISASLGGALLVAAAFVVRRRAGAKDAEDLGNDSGIDSGGGDVQDSAPPPNTAETA